MGAIVELGKRVVPKIIRIFVFGFGLRCGKLYQLEYNIGNGQLSDVTWSAHVMGRYLANAIVSDKSK